MRMIMGAPVEFSGTIDMRIEAGDVLEVMIRDNKLWVNINGECKVRVQSDLGPIIPDLAKFNARELFGETAIREELSDMPEGPAKEAEVRKRSRQMLWEEDHGRQA